MNINIYIYMCRYISKDANSIFMYINMYISIYI